MPAPLITLLTDFGLSDYYVAAMKGVILGICPEARLVDISHDIASFAIGQAGFILAQAWKCFPEGTIHLIVVDPGVGSERRPMIARAGGHWFVAPDNGVLTMVLESLESSTVYEITGEKYFRQPVSRTFHGRDIFAPVAAHLAAGIGVGELSTEMSDFVHISTFLSASTNTGGWIGNVLRIDKFGNTVLSFPTAIFGPMLSQGFELSLGMHSVTRRSQSYADGLPGELFVMEGSAGFLEVSVNKGDASQLLNVDVGDLVTFVVCQ